MKIYLHLWKKIACVFTLYTANGFASLTNEPSNTVVVLGQSRTVLRCSISNHRDIADWWWIPTGQTELIPIFQSHTLVYLYEDHITVDKGPNGQYNLVIHNVSFSDAGKYTCFDDGRLQSAVDNGYFASAELVIIGTDLNCSHNMTAGGILGSDICELGQEPDYLKLTCTMIHKGNSVPSLVWRQEGEDILAHVTNNVRHSDRFSVVSSTVVVQAQQGMNRSYFICSTYMNWNRSLTLNKYLQLNITWTSPVIDLLYIDRSRAVSGTVSETVCSSGAESGCFVPNNLDCEYRWIHPSNKITVVSNVLNPSQFTDCLGVYRCIVTCQLRGRTCNFKAKDVLAIDCAKNESSTLDYLVIASTGVPVSNMFFLPLVTLIFIPVILCLILIAFYRRRTWRQNVNNERASRNSQGLHMDQINLSKSDTNEYNKDEHLVTSKSPLVRRGNSSSTADADENSECLQIIIRNDSRVDLDKRCSWS